MSGKTSAVPKDGQGVFLGIFEGHHDPAVAVVSEGEVLAFVEEERLLRYKHAAEVYPVRALKYCVESLELDLGDIAAIGIHWNVPAYTDGTMARFFENMHRSWHVDARTTAWQRTQLARFNAKNIRSHHEQHWHRLFGAEAPLPPLEPSPHHYVHAFHAAMQAPFGDAICLTADGSGDQHTSVLWEKRNDKLRPLRAICMPHSLGWFYAAFTEYLGFEAYDGEYKVMGLAAFGRHRPELQEVVDRILTITSDGRAFELDPTFIHYGAHTYSDRFTDKLACLLGTPPRSSIDPIEPWHMDLAYAVQAALETVVERFVISAVRDTGLRNVCVGGGVGHNVKMNSRLFRHPDVDDIFAHPLCSDGGAAAGAALVACHKATGILPRRLSSVALGPEINSAGIPRMLEEVGMAPERPRDLCEAVADELERGKIVGWAQGRMEAGPRALGQRSIVADPRSVASRDRINAIVKHRENWRPFCPSMIVEAASRYFDRHTEAPFMTVAFDANTRLKNEAPAVVHVDGTARVQLVSAAVQPLYHRLLKAFERRTGVPVLLNTSFNVAGEPIVCSALDALRTFCATGIDVLVLGDFVIKKPLAAQ